MQLESQNNLVVIEGRATYERISSALGDLEVQEAIQQIQNFIKIYPEFAQAHNDLAVYYYKAGNALKSLAHYEKAHKLAPKNITFLKNLADFYMVELEWVDDAIHIYLGILKDNPFDVEVLNALGAISRNIGRKEQSRQYFSRALQLDPVSGEARLGLQMLGVTPQEPEVAAPTLRITNTEQCRPFVAPQVPVEPVRVQFGKPVEQSMPSPAEQYRKAVELAGAGSTDDAIGALQELLTASPGHALAHNDLGVLYQRCGNLDAALKHQELAASIEPSNTLFQKNLADLLFIGFSEYEKAMQIYVKLLSNAPKDVEILKAIAHICIEIGQMDNGRHFLELIIASQPWDQEARDALKQLDDNRKAETAKLVVPVASQEELYTQAEQLVKAGKNGEARVLLEQLVQQYGNYAVAHNDLGVLLYQDGDIQGARRCYERAVELEPLNQSFRKNLADLYFMEFKMTDEAIFIYLDLLKQNPRNVETLENLGHISRAIGQMEEARIFYRRALEIEPWNAAISLELQQLI